MADEIIALAQPRLASTLPGDGDLVWTPQLEAARIDLCEFLVARADDPHCLLVHVDLSRRLLEAEQALTILGEIALAALAPAPQPKGGE